MAVQEVWVAIGQENVAALDSRVPEAARDHFKQMMQGSLDGAMVKAVLAIDLEAERRCGGGAIGRKAAM